MKRATHLNPMRISPNTEDARHDTCIKANNIDTFQPNSDLLYNPDLPSLMNL